ncbi:KRAB [Lepeophtheirus salmonis]|uniref:KRAB n=1 Tax=Lepeophtheirus salmonis TaxID=72036 RepID=A0A7R8CBX6_LEPSM|nr:KRAB [Lepeophtheirus salmonis]CAF2762508.1 KRAB [Lepeophtheirus salmonis]
MPHEEDVEEEPMDEESFNVDQETGGIIINLGVEEADKFSALENLGKRRGRKVGEILKPKHKYPCPKCNKEWNWPWELRRHIVTHYREKKSAKKLQPTNARLVLCSTTLWFTRGEKPFQCAFCGNKFTQPANLRTHMKKKHPEMNCKGNKCPHCGEAFTSIVAVHQHVLDDHQNLVAEARENLELDRIKKEAEKIRKEKEKLEKRKIRIKEKVMNIAHGDRPYKRVNEWEMEYEFQLGEGLVRGVDWDRTPSNGELSCDQCDRKFGWRYEVMFHGLCHLVDEEGNAKNKCCTLEKPLFYVFIAGSSSKSKKGGSDNASDEKHGIKKEDKKSAVRLAKANSSLDSSVTVVVENEEGGNNVSVSGTGDSQTQETETIVIEGEQISNDQDMIVIVQSGEFEESQGLIVVDPSQIRQINGSRMEVEHSSNAEIAKETAQDESDESTYVVVDSNNRIHIQSQKDRGAPPTEEQILSSTEDSKIVLEREEMMSQESNEKNTFSSEAGGDAEPSVATDDSDNVPSSEQHSNSDSDVHTETIIEDTKVVVLDKDNA